MTRAGFYAPFWQTLGYVLLLVGLIVLQNCNMAHFCLSTSRDWLITIADGYIDAPLYWSKCRLFLVGCSQQRFCWSGGHQHCRQSNNVQILHQRLQQLCCSRCCCMHCSRGTLKCRDFTEPLSGSVPGRPPDYSNFCCLRSCHQKVEKCCQRKRVYFYWSDYLYFSYHANALNSAPVVAAVKSCLLSSDWYNSPFWQTAIPSIFGVFDPDLFFYDSLAPPALGDARSGSKLA